MFGTGRVWPHWLTWTKKINDDKIKLLTKTIWQWLHVCSLPLLHRHLQAEFPRLAVSLHDFTIKSIRLCTTNAHILAQNTRVGSHWAIEELNYLKANDRLYQWKIFASMKHEHSTTQSPVMSINISRKCSNGSNLIAAHDDMGCLLRDDVLIQFENTSRAKLV